jgi:Kef-type K+ transport system membrane component KefB/mannitol/fructose-specific phosphotransferase system IIA component (Ntr-type)
MEGDFGFFSPACIFLGVMSTATSVGISARILSEKRKLDSPEGVTILAGAVIDDVLGIIMLALGLGIIAASKKHGTIHWGHIGVIAAEAIGIWLAATLVGIVAARKISTLLKWFRDKSYIAIMALGLALILAALFEEANLAMIIGAYVMGLSLSKTDISHVIRENLHHIYFFLVPIFFAVMGMLVDVSLFFSWEIVLFGLLYSFLSILAKVFGCGIPAMFCNFNFRGGMRIGIGMLPRGEVALIIAGIGLASGILNQEIFAIGIMMTLITTIVAPPALVAIFNNDISGLRKNKDETPPAKIAFSLPSSEIVGLLSDKLQVIFENDGFYVHTLSHEDRIFQLRKDDVVIGFQNIENDIIFDCNENETQFVKTAMIEVIADFEQTVKELRKPVDINLITKNIPSKQSKKNKHSLAQFLQEKTMIPLLKGETKEEIINELLEQLYNAGAVDNLELSHAAIMKREDSMSTGMQFGIALPHGRTDGVKKLVAAVGLKPKGIDFKSMDGEPSTIFVLALSPESATAPHMQFMAMISNALDESGRDELLKCSTPKEMYQALTKS